MRGNYFNNNTKKNVLSLFSQLTFRGQLGASSSPSAPPRHSVLFIWLNTHQRLGDESDAAKAQKL